MDTIYIGRDITTAQMRVLPTEDSILDIVEEFMGREVRAELESLIEYKIEVGKSIGYDIGYNDCLGDLSNRL